MSFSEELQQADQEYYARLAVLYKIVFKTEIVIDEANCRQIEANLHLKEGTVDELINTVVELKEFHAKFYQDDPNFNPNRLLNGELTLDVSFSLLTKAAKVLFEKHREDINFCTDRLIKIEDESKFRGKQIFVLMGLLRISLTGGDGVNIDADAVYKLVSGIIDKYKDDEKKEQLAYELLTEGLFVTQLFSSVTDSRVKCAEFLIEKYKKEKSVSQIMNMLAQNRPADRLSKVDIPASIRIKGLEALQEIADEVNGLKFEERPAYTWVTSKVKNLAIRK